MLDVLITKRHDQHYLAPNLKIVGGNKQKGINSEKLFNI